MGVIPSTVEKVFFLWGGSGNKPHDYTYLPKCYLISRKNLLLVWDQKAISQDER